MAEGSTGSPNMCAECRGHSFSQDWATTLTQYNLSGDGDQMPSRDTSKTRHWWDHNRSHRLAQRSTYAHCQMTRCYNQFWIVHSTSGICHIPAIAENFIDNRRWHTVCGWYYGSSTFKKSFNKPTKDRCLIKCFRYTEITDVQEIDLSESDEDH